MSGGITVKWTETWTVEHEMTREEALAFHNDNFEPNLPETATLEEIRAGLEEMDLVNDLAQIGLEDWTDANVERDGIEVELN
jgi:hypothetical protein